MSYRIEYQWASWRLTAGPDTGGVDRFVVAIEGGDNNLRDAVTGKRARSWEVCMLGSAGAGAQAGRLLRRRLRGWLPQAGLAGLLTGGVHPAHSPPHRGRYAAGARLLVPLRSSCRGAPARGPRDATGSPDRARAAVWRMVRASGALRRAAQPDLRLRRQVPRPARLAAGSRRRPAGELSPTLFPLSDSSGAFLEPRVHGGSREAVVWAYSHLWNQVAMRAWRERRCLALGRLPPIKMLGASS